MLTWYLPREFRTASNVSGRLIGPGLKLLNQDLSPTSSTDEFRIDPFDNDIPYDWARPPRKQD